MSPESVKGEKGRRRQRRSLEIEIITSILRHLPEMNQKAAAEREILEFGAGDGFQIAYLRTLGEVTASDIYVSENIRANHHGSFVEGDISKAPFAADTFDLIFSNHVIEHIEDLKSAFNELKRVGRDDCIYAFSVPTALWLVISIPAQYYNKLTWVLRKLFRRTSGDATAAGTLGARQAAARNGTGRTLRQIMGRIARAILPGGHGCYRGFINCWRHFRTKAWQATFRENGFEIVLIKPLLLYIAAELPLMPAFSLQAYRSWCSSVLFIMKRSGKKQDTAP
jgi:SAM-dependent methyltransferase